MRAAKLRGGLAEPRGGSLTGERRHLTVLFCDLVTSTTLAAQALKGIARPVQLYRVIQPSGVRGRLEAAAATRGLTPFVGEDELRLLMSPSGTSRGSSEGASVTVGLSKLADEPSTWG
jgi:hypothetical protein